MRLTKSRQRYMETRDGLREAAYEALLAAGREDWAPGERVRCYRVRGGSFAWLPDADDGPPSPGALPPRNMRASLKFRPFVVITMDVSPCRHLVFAGFDR